MGRFANYWVGKIRALLWDAPSSNRYLDDLDEMRYQRQRNQLGMVLRVSRDPKVLLTQEKTIWTRKMNVRDVVEKVYVFKVRNNFNLSERLFAPQ